MTSSSNLIEYTYTDRTPLLDHLPIGIVRLNKDKHCVYANKYVFDVLGTTSLENISSFMESHVHEDDKKNEQKVNLEFFESRLAAESICRLYDKKLGEHRWMQRRRIIIEETKIEYLFVLQDIHDNKRMEIQLRQESQKAEDAYNHKTTFLANMSHEIRTPLNGIIGMLTLLEDTTLTNDQCDYISMVKECSFNLMTIINDILDYSKLEVGKIVLDTKPMSLCECIESTSDIILSKVYEKKIEYVPNLHANIPLAVMSDSNRLKQIVLNMLSNAIKFTDKGYIYLNVEAIDHTEYILLEKTYKSNTLSLDPVSTESNTVYIRFDITDTGCGIADEDREKLFKSFSQIDNRLTTKIYQGTGLGLVISKELVELMGGFIWLDWSEVNKGSRFSFVIKTEICDPRYANCEVGSEDILNDVRVLIVDDNLHNRLALVGTLTKWGMRPQIFSNAEEALLFSRFSKFDIGLIDVCMPKMDGSTFASKIVEQLGPDNTFPLIALSSLGDKNTSISKHFVSHLVKPVKEQRLKRTCVDILKKYSTTDTPQVSSRYTGTKDKTLQHHVPDIDIKNNVRILLAEDVYINQRVIVSFLNKIGYKNIQITNNGQECLEMIYKQDFDIILLDIRMPIVNGEVVLQKMEEYYQNRKDKRKPYVVAVTAYCLREDQKKYIDLGFDDYIPKPITFADLIRCMDKFLSLELQE
jgi:signal transduction histidine kinase/DNA-binding response OmpR family regulator